MNVVITDCDHGDVDRERALLTPRFDLTVADCRTEDDVLAVAAGADAVICQYAPVTDRVLAGLPRCRVVVRYGVGYDNIDTEAAAARGIWVANVPDYGVEEVAAHALTLSLTLLRGVDRLARRVRAGEWDYRAARPLRRISELTLGVIGYGRIGATYARMATGLGARVLVSDVRPLPAAGLTPGARAVALPDLLAAADLISVHVPAGAGGVLLGPAEIAAMRPGAYLVNTARGSLVDQDALLAALDDGRLAGAGLDVLAEEPPPLTGLVGHERVVVTPHSAWYSEEAFRMLKDDAAREVARVLDGGPPRHPVNDVRAAAGR
ncbi:C-terminal binding protein [Actinoplanes sp. M2I2]|uniref:C-terminal binding protein n=1 Tax=Actinoplanes sp. M2I2 TaxID=1734444 RepID=UPI0020215F73|nr:C-terminal binding protein [Actinoplanes sp. M2I2]